MIPHTARFVEFEADDLKERSASALAEYLQVSRAFVQLCFDAGFPVRTGVASAAELLEWLSRHYGTVREVAGLLPLDANPDRTVLPQKKIAWANAVATLLDFGISRASGNADKGAIWAQKRRLDRALTHARLARQRFDQ